jgi:hypothetical protein
MFNGSVFNDIVSHGLNLLIEQLITGKNIFSVPHGSAGCSFLSPQERGLM